MPRWVAIFLLIVMPATVTIAEIILMILAPSPFVLKTDQPLSEFG